MTLTWLAEATDIERVTLRRYVIAERHLHVTTLEQIAAALDMEPWHLVQRAGTLDLSHSGAAAFPTLKDFP